MSYRADGQQTITQRYYPWGTIRPGPNNALPTDYTFTGQKLDESTGLMYYGARYYDPALGRFISADPIVPEPGNPQDLNRYAYVRNNPLRYRDPSGHCPLCIAWRLGYEVSMLLFADRIRRDQIGGQLVTQVSDTITRQASDQGVDPSLVSAILRHESAAFERRVLTSLSIMAPDLITSMGEGVQVLIQGDTASIGPGQMQLRRARELEQLGYVTARESDLERVRALLGKETSVEYVTGMVRYLSDQLSAVAGFSDLSPRDQQRLILIGYNLGWEGEKGLKANIEKYGFEWVIDSFDYDNETLDEYLRWRAEQ